MLITYWVPSSNVTILPENKLAIAQQFWSPTIVEGELEVIRPIETP
jgi:hypothetical protein